MDIRHVIAAAVVIVLGAWFFWPDPPPLPPEQAVSAALDEIVAAAEGGSPKTIIERLSKSFSSPHGSRQDVKTMIVMRLQRGGWSKIFFVSRDITATDATHVTTSLDTVLARGGNVQSLEDVVPESAGAWHFDLEWALEEDVWRIVSAEYSRQNIRRLLP